jgi:cell division septation protein DedD
LPRNDEGEFELVLGNRQLLGVFVIVVILLGVFFSMGYVVGRNSSAAAVDVARAEKPKPDHDADSSDDSSGGQPPEATGAPQADSATSAVPESTKPAQTQPPTPLPVQAPPKPEPIRGKEVKPKPSPAPPQAAHQAAPPVHAAAAGEPAGGQYWQVVATARPDAEIIAEALGKKGFHVVIAPAPKDGIFRVLIGPLPDASSQAQTRTGLESAGFKNPMLRKY